MKILETMKASDYEQLVFCQDEKTGLKGIIAIHDTTLGPALGGTRMWTYDNEEEAIEDVLRLARGMTYKSAAAGLNLGGGKGVIIGDPKKDKSEEMWRAFGRFVQSLNGRYITAEDVGVRETDLEIVNTETDFAVGLPGKSGNPSPATAYGVYSGIKAVADEIWGSADLNGKTIAIQGAGSVGYYLSELLHKDGAKLIVTDIDKEAVDKLVSDFGATAVETDEIYEQEADIFAPCALGAILNDETIPKLKVKAVAGAANNQLEDEKRHAEELKKRGIVYAPDYVINAGGVINVSFELTGYDEERAYRKISTIYDNIKKIFNIANRDDITSHEAANRMAEERIEAIKHVKTSYINK
ncbi:Glu/Leu/Phe/Val family dehydrogenase [Natranaerobius thermophilus]|uniref:Leucine dehydrogenase n=1 Tax=Natranaerobius thermophilus (strain ATCC BAA-1301 / DSM 18059 / JW/NM-WN-LF) TaxID=457570 RepID=B2A513_NATTJ|nr:Glu/Leu/Phe/Val dehydrogenase [Natranaerobius thermophilus]ACB85255.1 leucine dehydrogenase [Natranaerobius thermophilus JW/NM-WN-LF]